MNAHLYGRWHKPDDADPAWLLLPILQVLVVGVVVLAFWSQDIALPIELPAAGAQGANATLQVPLGDTSVPDASHALAIQPAGDTAEPVATF